jgi:hypothetical protein
MFSFEGMALSLMCTCRRATNQGENSKLFYKKAYRIL